MSRLSLGLLALSVALITVISGCRSLTQPVIWYSLRPISGNPSDMDAVDSNPMTIGIRPVILPGTINRTQMVIRDGAYRLSISSLHRWADYPDRLVQRLLAENLQLLMPDAHIVNTPWPAGLKPDFSIAFDFLELIGTDDEKMHLNVEWRIVSADPRAADQYHRTTLVEPMDGSGYDGLAAAHSRVLEALCREVARRLRALQ